MPAKKKSVQTKVVSKKPVKKVPLVKATKPDQPSRVVQQSRYRAFRLSTRIRSAAPPLPSSFVILADARKLLTSRWKLFLGVISIYVVFSFILTNGLDFSSNIKEVKDGISGAFGGGFLDGAITGIVLVGYLIGNNAKPASGAGGAYQIIMLIMASLAFVWALRQTHAGIKVTVKEAYYRGMYPLVQVLLVLMLISIQLLPIVVGNFLYGAVYSGGIAITILEKVLWGLLIFLLLLWSIYMLTASIFALYIVTLPDIMPIQAFRSALELVLHRRWLVMRRILFMPIAFVVIGVVLMAPIAYFLTPIAPYIFFFYTVGSIALVHAYLYSLYRRLL